MDASDDRLFSSVGTWLPPPPASRGVVGLGLRSDTGVLILGEEVTFLRGDDEEVVICPPEALLARDLSGQQWSPCDLHVLLPITSVQGLGKARFDVEPLAKKYYGNGARLKVVDLAEGSGPWQSRGRIDTIWYRRRGTYKGRYTHRFAFPVALQSRGEQAYRLRLPSGCVANDRGLVWP